MKRPSDLLRKRLLQALGTQSVPSIAPSNLPHDVWRTCFAHLAAGGLISRSSAYPLGLTAHFLIGTVTRDPAAETALSVQALHRTMRDSYRPPFQIALPSFSTDVARWGYVAGFAVTGDDIRGARLRTHPLGEEAIDAFLEAMRCMGA
jgi:hypothetical protein